LPFKVFPKHNSNRQAFALFSSFKEATMKKLALGLVIAAFCSGAFAQGTEETAGGAAAGAGGAAGASGVTTTTMLVIAGVAAAAAVTAGATTKTTTNHK
jgi:hypothetical protein